MSENTSMHTRLGSYVATAGVLVLAVGIAIKNAWIWIERGDWVSAVVTLSAEAVAVGGFVMVLHHWRGSKLRAVGAGIVTLLAATWGALTLVEDQSGKAHQRAIDETKQSNAYVQAEKNLQSVSAAYSAALVETVPQGLGPLTTKARADEIQQRRETLKAERDQSQKRLDALLPKAAAVDGFAAARGAGIMAVILLGLSAVGFRSKPKELGEAPKKITETIVVEAEPAKASMTASEAGRKGVEARRAKKAQEEQRRLAKNAYQREWRAKRAGKWSKELFGEPLNQQPL